MGLFDKKFCDICGGQISLLGNRKLDDGNCCKDCAGKLSPFFSERRRSTVADIKKQLAYRSENEKKLGSVKPTRTIGGHKKIYLDVLNKKFVVSSSSNWMKTNPDIVDFSMVKSVEISVNEDKDEILTKDESGKEVSYNPARYEYEYTFEAKMLIDHPYFDEIRVELSDSGRPDSPLSDEYKSLEKDADDLMMILCGKHFVNNCEVTYVGETEEVPAEDPADTLKEGEWKCACGKINSGKFCTECGSPKPVASIKFCPECGTELNGAKFCPECGKKVE